LNHGLSDSDKAASPPHTDGSVAFAIY